MIKKESEAKGGVAVITMVRDDLFFLQKWLHYYGAHFGNQNLYVIAHGGAPEIVSAARECSVVKIPIKSYADTVHQHDYNRSRADLVQGLTRGLLKYYDIVIYTDVDEFIVLDPTIEGTLYNFLLSVEKADVLSPFGLDVVHVKDESEGLDAYKPILSVRHYCRLAAKYTKPIVTRKEIVWAGGFHHSSYNKLTIPKGLYLFHMKWSDINLAINMRRNRYLGSIGKRPEIGLNLEASDEVYPLRQRHIEKIKEFSSWPRVDDFGFDKDIHEFKLSWRRNLFFMSKSYWMSILTSNSERHIRYWRFNERKKDTLYRIPDRFSSIV